MINSFSIHLLLAAASLGALPVHAELTATQKAFCAVVKSEIVQQGARKAIIQGDLDLAARIKSEDTVSAGMVVSFWPYALGPRPSAKSPQMDPEPPIAKPSFDELMKTLSPRVLNPSTNQSRDRTPMEFYVQFSRSVGALAGVENRGAPYALAAALPPGETEGAAAALNAMFRMDSLDHWKLVVPLAVAGLIKYADGAEKALESALAEFIKIAPQVRSNPGASAGPTRDEQVILGLNGIRIKLDKAPKSSATLARIKDMKAGLDELDKKLKESR